MSPKRYPQITEALWYGDLAGIERLVAGGAPVDEVDPEGRTPLIEAVVKGNEAVVALLISNGANVNHQDRGLWSALHFAAQAQATAIAQRLLDAGALVDPRDKFGNTPLWRAVMTSKGKSEFIQLLRRHGADPHAENSHGVSPLTLANTIANYPIAQYFADLGSDREC